MTWKRAVRGAPASPEAVSRSVFAFRRNLVLAASAGTGKTYALVGVAVHLLVGASELEGGGLAPPILPESLVATTFSRKAAAEIRVRLASELEKLASGDATAAYRSDVLAATGPVSELEIASRAERALARLGRARIGTLHGFAASIVRAHALVLGLPPEFDLLDQEATRERATYTIERVLEERVGDAEMAALIEMAGSVSTFIDAVQDLLARIDDDGKGAAMLALADRDEARVDALFRTLVHQARVLTDDPKLGREARLFLAACAQGDARSIEEAAGALMAVRNTKNATAAAEAFFVFRDDLPGATTSEKGRRLVRLWQVRGRMRPRAEALRSFLAACEQEIRRESLVDAALGFSDVLRAARDLLRDHPTIAAEMGRDLAALLVDELQDTSGVQRDLIHLLWEHRPEGSQLRLPGTIPRAADLRRRGLLVVGDRKQSIYGFRGADASIFAELCVGLAGAPARQALAVPCGLVPEPTRPTADFISLRHNRRGEPELLAFTNAWSRLALVPEGRPAALYEVDYVPGTEDLLPPRPAPNLDVPRVFWLTLPVPDGKRSTDPLAEGGAIASRIARIVGEGDIRVRGEPARYRDIAILAEKHGALEAASHALALAGIPHVVAGMGFYGAREVRDMIAMLACLVDPEDTHALIEVLRGPWAGVSDRTLVGLTDAHKGVAPVARWGVGERRSLVWDEDRPSLLALRDTLLALRPVVDRVGAGVALREAVTSLGLEEVLLLLPRGEQRVANVRKLLARAELATDARLLLDELRAAAERSEREGEAATFSDDDDAVRLLTVHGAKGLAFPVVFLPGVASSPRPHNLGPFAVATGAGEKPTSLVLRVADDVGYTHDSPSYADVSRELRRREAAERQRVRYVAVTRAAVAMFFVGNKAPPTGAATADDRSMADLLARLAGDPHGHLTVLTDGGHAPPLTPA